MADELVYCCGCRSFLCELPCVGHDPRMLCEKAPATRWSFVYEGPSRDDFIPDEATDKVVAVGEKSRGGLGYFLVCRFKNTDGHCPDYQPKTRATPTSPPEPPPPRDPPPMEMIRDGRLATRQEPPRVPENVVKGYKQAEAVGKRLDACVGLKDRPGAW